MDETQDVSCKEQATVIIRYVEQCGKIAEEFIGFNQAINLTGNSTVCTALTLLITTNHNLPKQRMLLY